MLLQPELLLIALLATGLPALYAALTARLAGPGPHAHLRSALAFLWGAVVASSLASVLNDLAGGTLPAFVGAARARTLVPALVGPAIEEVLKTAGVAAALVGSARSVRAAIVTGAIVGFGFAAAENVTYYTLAAVQGGWNALGRAVYLRGVIQGANHAAFSAVAGAALGWSRLRRAGAGARLVAVALGLAVAIVVHAVWNGVVSREITSVLCNAGAAGGPCAAAPGLDDLALHVPALEAAFLFPVVGALGWLVRRSRA